MARHLRLATRDIESVSRPRTSDAQRNPAPDQHETDEWRNPLTVTGLNAEVGTSDLNTLRLGVRDRHDQGGDAEHQ
jgi:hypothetical protein